MWSTTNVDGGKVKSTIIGDIVLHYEGHHQRWAQNSPSPILREYHARAQGPGDVQALAQIAVEKCPEILNQEGDDRLERAQHTNMLHLRTGDIFKENDINAYTSRRPPSVEHLADLKRASFPNDEPNAIVTAMHWSTPEATNKSLQFIQDLQVAAGFDDVQSGNPDVDWCSCVHAKRFIVGKGGFSRTAGLVREELGRPTIWDLESCTYDYDERPGALPIPRRIQAA